MYVTSDKGENTEQRRMSSHPKRSPPTGEASFSFPMSATSAETVADAQPDPRCQPHPAAAPPLTRCFLMSQHASELCTTFGRAVPSKERDSALPLRPWFLHSGGKRRGEYHALDVDVQVRGQSTLCDHALAFVCDRVHARFMKGGKCTRPHPWLDSCFRLRGLKCLPLQ